MATTIRVGGLAPGDYVAIFDACGRWVGEWHEIIEIRPVRLGPIGGCSGRHPDCRHWDMRDGVAVLLDHREGLGHDHTWSTWAADHYVEVAREESA